MGRPDTVGKRLGTGTHRGARAMAAGVHHVAEELRTMKQLPYLLLCAAAMVGFGTTASAQFGPENGPYRPQAVDTLVQRVHTDLNSGYDRWHLADGDRNRLNNAEKKLRAFAQDWEHAKFDKGDLDDSISAIQHVLDNNHLQGAERDALSGDVDSLRHMREAYNRHEIGKW
jgi:hypothetical protein